MSGLLDGLSAYGLQNLENMSLYEKPEEQKKPKEVPKQIQEQDFLFDKSTVCPVCGKEFKSKTVRVGKAKLLGSDIDLRPKYEHIDMLKYDVISCPYCGYTALSRFFQFMTSLQKKAIVDKISSSFKRRRKEEKEIYTYEDALERYKLALVNSIVKNAKPSEKGYICLKTAWLLRGMGESLDQKASDYKEKKKEIDEQENVFMNSAMEGFLSARQTEEYPMCGMDESTVDYIIAVMAIRFGQYDLASRLIGGIMTSTTANPRMKDKARILKDIVIKKIREQK